MNKIYRIVWNSQLCRWVVTSELGRAKIKGAANIISLVTAALIGGTVVSVCSAAADTTISSGTSPVNLAQLPMDTNYVVAADVTLATTDNSSIYGDSSQNWHLTNYGSVLDNASSYNGGAAVFLDSLNAGGSRLDNYGTISQTTPGDNSSAVRMDNGGVVYNHAGATLSASGAYAVGSATQATDIFNDGNLTSANTTVRLMTGGSLTQSATGILQSTGGVALLVDNGNVTVSNAGAIESAVMGLMIRGNSAGNVTNSGTIAAGTAVITQSNAAITFINSGTLTGTSGTAINFASSNNLLILQTGSQINGNITSSGSNNTLALQGSGSADNMFSGFSTVSAQDSGIWSLGGSMTTTAASACALDIQHGTLIVSGQINNTGTGAGASISNGGTLQIGNGSNTGSVTGDITDNAALVFNRADDVMINATISGSGTVAQSGSGRLTLSGSNTYSGNTQIYDGTLAIATDDNIGDGSATNGLVLNGGNLMITADFASSRTVQFAQAGSLIVDPGVTATMSGWNDLGNATHALTKTGDGTLIFTGDNSANTSDVNIIAGTVQVETLGQLASAEGVLSLSEKGVLAVQGGNEDMTLSRQLTGNGQLIVDLGSSKQQFNFAQSAAGGHYSGLMTLNAGQMAMDNNSADVLKNASLQLNQQGSTILTGEQTLQSLTFNGGKLGATFTGGTAQSQGRLSVNTLDTSNGGQIAVTAPDVTLNPHTTGGPSLFDQQNDAIMQIIAADNVVGSGSLMTLIKADGSALGNDVVQILTQSGQTVGDLHYNYSGLVQDKGLYIGYALTQIDVSQGQNVVLDNSLAEDNSLGAQLSGAGGFDINATGDVRIGNATSDYTGETHINSGSVTLLTDNAFGNTSGLTLADNTHVDLNGNSQAVGVLNIAATSELAFGGGQLSVRNGGRVDGELSGGGSLNLTGGTLILTQNNSQFDGTFVIDPAATLVVGETQQQQNASLTGNVIIAQNATLGGYGIVNGDVQNGGLLSVGQALTGNGHGVFTLNGDYQSNGGTVAFDTDMGSDDSSTDQLVVTGSTSGDSRVTVQSARGAGADTVDGIKLIGVNGASSAGQFTLAGRAVGGSYEYFLRQGTSTNPDNGDWYLTSAQPGSGGDGGGTQSKTLRPEAGGYMANMAAAQTLFNHSLSDRQGRVEDSSLWMRQAGSHSGFSDGSGQLDSTANGYVVQLGGEVLSTAFGQTDRLGVGVMGGYGYNKNHTDSSRTGYRSDGTVEGYSAGIYATWYEDASTRSGAYIDSWMQYSWLNATQQADETQAQHYDINGLSASVESGYRIPMWETQSGQVFITPQVQVIWDGQKADSVKDESGTQIESAGNDAVHSRLGVRFSHEGVSTQDLGKDKLFTVFSEVNWLYSIKEAGTSMDDVTVNQAGTRNVGEMKLGVEGKLNKQLNLWSNVGQQMGGDGYNDSRLTLGIKYAF